MTKDKRISIDGLLFRYYIGEKIEGKDRTLTVLDVEVRKRTNDKGETRRDKYYKVHCSKCGQHTWRLEGSMGVDNVNCAVCRGRQVVKGYNDISTTNPDLLKYFVNKEDAFTNSSRSHSKVKVACPCCKRVKEMIVLNLCRRGFSCSICDDKTSYSERFVANIFEQLKIDFVHQVGKSDFKWCNNFKYDFCFELNGELFIVETHGIQHYEDSFGWKNKKTKTLKEEQDNDAKKMELALSNGVKPENYVVIDCRKSEMEWVKQSVTNSRLSEVLDLENIDWILCGKRSKTSLMQQVCEYWNLNKDIETTQDLSKNFGISLPTIRKYLKIGTDIGICNYSVDEEKERRKSIAVDMTIKRCSKRVEVVKDGVVLGVFDSAIELCRASEEVFGVKFNKSSVSSVCLGKTKKHNGFTFRFC